MEIRRRTSSHRSATTYNEKLPLPPITYLMNFVKSYGDIPIYFSPTIITILAILDSLSRSPTFNNSKPLNQSTIFIGSSLFASPNKTNYLLSPSGTYAFGFKSLGEGEKYKIGIWIANSTEKTLVWVPNPSHDEPVEKDSSIVLNGKGEFVIRRVGFMDERLMKSVSKGLVSRAVIQDSGNFVMYNNESRIVWQSFDNPTDTIVQGQTLKSGGYLLSKIADYSLEMEERGDLVVKRKEFYHGSFKWYYHWRSNTGNKGSPVELKLDGDDGRLYIVYWDLRVIKNFTNGEKRSAGESIFRATMYSDGIFRLYEEKIGLEEAQTSVLLWQSGCIPCDEAREMERRDAIANLVIKLLVGFLVLVIGGGLVGFIFFG